MHALVLVLANGPYFFTGFNGFFVTTQEQSVQLWDTETLSPLETFEMGGLLTSSDVRFI